MIKNFLHLFLIISLNIFDLVSSWKYSAFYQRDLLDSFEKPFFHPLLDLNFYMWQFQTYMWQFQTYMWQFQTYHVSDNSKPSCEWQFQIYMWVTYMWQFHTYMWQFQTNIFLRIWCTRYIYTWQFWNICFQLKKVKLQTINNLQILTNWKGNKYVPWRIA